MIIKICNTCNKKLPIDNFYLRKNRKIYRTDCNKCHVEKIRLIQKQKLKYIQEYKVECCTCGYSKCKEALDLHHKDPNKKEYQPNKLINYSYKKIKKELEKCIVLCANCHRELHAQIK